MTGNNSTSLASVPTLKFFLSYRLTTESRASANRMHPMSTSALHFAGQWFDMSQFRVPWSLSFQKVPRTYNFLAWFSEIHAWLHAESLSTKIFSVLNEYCKLTQVIVKIALISITKGIPRLSSVLFVAAITLFAVILFFLSIFLGDLWKHSFGALEPVIMSAWAPFFQAVPRTGAYTERMLPPQAEAAKFVFCKDLHPLSRLPFAKHRTTPQMVFLCTSDSTEGWFFGLDLSWWCLTWAAWHKCFRSSLCFRDTSTWVAVYGVRFSGRMFLSLMCLCYVFQPVLAFKWCRTIPVLLHSENFFESWLQLMCCLV